MKKEILIIVLLLLISIPAVKSLFIPGGFTSHDLTHHVIRQISMDKLLSEGQFPPRWSGELNNGFGYPLFLFNYPLPSMLGELFHLTGLGYVDSVKLVLFTSMIISILGMYLFLRSLIGSKLAAFLGAVFYLYAPIRFLNVYVSAAVGSALALGILPFVFWSIVELTKGKKWAFFKGSLSFALLILAHNVTTLIFAPVLLIFALLMGKRRVIRKMGIMFLLGLGLSAWFWLPALLEKQSIKFDEVFNGFYKDQFINFWQLIKSPWGYGLSHPQNPEQGDMSYQLGLIHIAVVLAFSIWFIVYGSRSKDKVLGAFAIATFFTSIFLMLKISLPVWESLPFLSLVQFPLRFSAVAVFSASITAALLVKYVSYKRIIFVILLGLVLYANRNHWRINESFNPGEQYYLNLKPTTASFNEHLPKWGRAMKQASPGKLEFVKGNGYINVINNKSAHILAEIEASDDAQIRLNQFYFPGWEIKIDNEPITVNYLTDTESYGLPLFDLEQGKHKVLAEFKNTPLRNLADTLSITAVVIWLGLLCKLLLRK